MKHGGPGRKQVWDAREAKVFGSCLDRFQYRFGGLFANYGR
jgi:hypothetical protein